MGEIMTYMLYGAPFVVVLIDLIVSRDVSLNHRRMGIFSLAVAVVCFWAMHGSGENVLLLAIPLFPALIYGLRTNGLPRFLIMAGNLTVWCIGLAGASSGNSNLSFHVHEMANLPPTILLLLVPPLLLWHLWQQLPLVYDRLRGGNWDEAGVPPTARHAFLAVILVVSLAANIVVYYQMTGYRSTVDQQARNAFFDMWGQLHMAGQMLTNSNQDTSGSWRAAAAECLQGYRRAALDLTSWTRRYGMSTDSGLYFLTSTLPEGVDRALQQQEPALTSEQANKLGAALAAGESALQDVQDKKGFLFSLATYQTITDRIVPILRDGNLLDFFDLKYVSR